MKDARLQRVLSKDLDHLSEHMKRNASLGPSSRYFSLTEEDAALVAAVMAKSEAAEEEEDPYSGVLGLLDAFEDDEASEGEGSPAKSVMSLSEEGSAVSRRLEEIDRKLDEYSLAGSVPSTPRALLSAQASAASSAGLLPRLSPDSVISGSAKGRARKGAGGDRDKHLREARELKALLRMERDIDAKITQLRQSELELVPREEIDLLLQNLYTTSWADLPPASPAGQPTQAAAEAEMATEMAAPLPPVAPPAQPTVQA